MNLFWSVNQWENAGMIVKIENLEESNKEVLLCIIDFTPEISIFVVFLSIYINFYHSVLKFVFLLANAYWIYQNFQLFQSPQTSHLLLQHFIRNKLLPKYTFNIIYVTSFFIKS